MRELVRIAMLAVFALTCAAACSDEGKIEDAAEEAARAKLEKKIGEEAEGKIADRPIIKKILISTLMNRSEFEALKPEIAGSSATASVRVKTVPQSVRFALLEILAEHDRAKDNAINVAEVLKGVLQNMKLNADEKSETVEKFSLRNNDGWKVNDER